MVAIKRIKPCEIKESRAKPTNNVESFSLEGEAIYSLCIIKRVFRRIAP